MRSKLLFIVLFITNITTFSQCLKGNCENGLGTYKYKTGATYVGEWLNGNSHGKGTFISDEGDKYEGDFQKGKQHGKGIFIYKNGDKYEGEWVNGYMHGYGIYRFKNGDKYDGELVTGNFHGKGTFTYSDGDEYIGEYLNGKKHGNGIFTLSGNKLIGEFIDDRLKKGTYIDKNGDKYVGELLSGKPHGYGIFTFSDGRINKGIFENGNYLGEEKLVSQNDTNLKQESNKIIKKSDDISDIHSVNFENFLNRFNSINSSNSTFSGTINPYPSNPSESFYKTDYTNNKISYQGFMKEVITGSSGNTVYKSIYKHGTGKEYFINSNGYLEGFFINNKLNGYGVQVSDGYSYRGYYVNGDKNGEGILVSDGLNGTTKYIYEGNFSNNKFNGKGVLIYDFMAFMGEFINGEMKFGTAYYPKGIKYIGAIVNGKYQGAGEYYWNNGNVYKGEFKDGKFHGSGELKYSNGSIQKGVFENGNYVGEEKQITQNNSNLTSNNNQQSNANKYPNSKLSELTVDGKNISNRVEDMLATMYTEIQTKKLIGSMISGSKSSNNQKIINQKVQGIKEVVVDWLGGPLTKAQLAEFKAINNKALAQVQFAMGLVSTMFKNSGSSSSSSSSSSNASKSSSSSSNSSNNSVCTMCKPYDAKGHYIRDYDSNNKRYLNGRYILKPGYKLCSTCHGTGNCKAYSMCSSSQERDGNYTCQRCHGDRFELCSRCKGSGK
jgi:hypothetical protein